MKRETLKKAVSLGKKLGSILVATADSGGIPHITAAGKMFLDAGGRVLVEQWFCPGTMANLESNPLIALAVWDEKNDIGHQLFGRVLRVQDMGMMNGFAPGEEKKEPMPQVERRLVIHVDRVTAFRRAPHSDVEE